MYATENQTEEGNKRKERKGYTTATWEPPSLKTQAIMTTQTSVKYPGITAYIELLLPEERLARIF